MVKHVMTHPGREEKTVSGAYPVIFNDLIRDNLENDIPAADLEGLSSDQSLDEVNKMDNNNLPLGFSFALARNPDAMRNFSTLPESRQSEILQKARSVSSKDEMQALVNDLSVRT